LSNEKSPVDDDGAFVLISASILAEGGRRYAKGYLAHMKWLMDLMT
jgi:hypothetical protein